MLGVLLVAFPLSAATNGPEGTNPSATAPDPNDSVEKEYKKLMEDDDAVQSEVDKWIRDNEQFAAKGAGMPSAELSRRIRERLEPIRKGYQDFIKRHPDHVRASRLATEASFYAGLRALKGGAAHRPQSVIYYASSYTQQPSFFVDVTDFFETKMKAIRCFSSQFYDPSSTEPETVLTQKTFLDAIEARARAYGKLINVTYAEAFVSPRPPTLADPVAAFAGYEPGFDGPLR